jgi:hypothetical protein
VAMNVATAAIPIFNLQPRVERVPLPNGEFCLVVDDAFAEPERIVEFAVAHRASFRNVDFNAYPGTYLLSPANLSAALSDFFMQHLRRFFDARRIVSMHCRFSMVTLRPEELRPYQWFCHRDSLNVPAPQSIQASVLYLFKDAELGGTSFYEPAVSPAEIAVFNRDAWELSNETFARKYGLAPGYMVESNRYFTKIGSIPARWNRLIFYYGSVLHSGDIVAPEKLSPDPASGRLTFNGFFTCRRNAS